MTAPLDLDWADAGYLRTASGSLRQIRGLDILAADARLLGVRVEWEPLTPRRPGYCRWQEGVIVLADWLGVGTMPWFVRAVLGHELAHYAVGPSEDRVSHWVRRYGELIEPPEWC